MSIIGNFLRVTPAELAHLRADTTRVHSFVHGIVMAELKGPPLPPEQARSLFTAAAADGEAILRYYT